MNFKEGLAVIYEEAVTCFGEDRVDINVHSNLFLYIHFPKFTISNRDSLSHEITNLYVRIEFNENLEMRGFSGTRTTISEEEKNLSYHHSHLEQNSTLGRFQSFCTGGSIISGLMSTLRSTFNKNTFSAFLFTLEEMMAWESQEGVPYVHIKNLSSRRELRDLDISTVEENNIYTKFLKNIGDLSYNLNVLPTEINLTINEKEVESILTKIINDRHKCEYSGGDYYSTSNGNSSYSEDLGHTSWYFKGKKLPVSITPATIDIQTELIAHPHLTKKIYEQFTKEFKTFLEGRLTA